MRGIESRGGRRRKGMKIGGVGIFDRPERRLKFVVGCSTGSGPEDAKPVLADLDDVIRANRVLGDGLAVDARAVAAGEIADDPLAEIILD